jgi:transcription factor SFP1
MTGTSPFTLQSPSYHSSSYLPKLEANFMRDFACCGVTLPSLHDLLQHYEEAHAQKSSQPQQRTSQGGPAAISDNRGQPNTSTLQQQAQQNQQPSNNGVGRNFPSQPSNNQQGPNIQQSTQHQTQAQGGGFGSSHVHGLPDIDTVEDMEMDDALGETDVSQLFHQSQANESGQHRFGQQNQGRVTPLNLGMLQGHQGLRGSQPGTPTSSGRPISLQNNPTVSSVNTPTLMNHPLQQQQNLQYRGTPDSSTPGTPAELDDNVVGGFGDMSMQNHPLMQNSSQLSGFGGGNNDMLDLCIDEPAKRLFSPTGGFNNNSQEYAHFRLGGAQYGPNSEIARRIREQQKLAGVPDTTLGMMPNEEPKPFRCPVIGCEKAYKNQNGLKYHKSVSNITLLFFHPTNISQLLSN